MAKDRLLVPRELEGLLLQKTQAALRERAAAAKVPPTAIVEWAQRKFYIAETGEPIVLESWQQAVLRGAFTRDPISGRLPYRLVIISTIKKSGKTTMGAVVGRWVAEEQTRFGEIYAMGNDLKQAQERSFEKIAVSLRMTPGFRRRGVEGYIPDYWYLQATKMGCLASGSKIEALSVDARGEAGANPDLTIWTELWGFEMPEAVKFFHEMTPPPTKPDSIRLVETYAGFDGESLLLRSLYDLGRQGHQLTAGELAGMTDTPLGSFKEAPHDTDLVPIWINPGAGLFMLWDSGLQARRMVWQGADYYAEEEKKLPSPTFHRIHMNEWVGGEGEFIPMASWDRCRDLSLPFLEPGDKTPAVLAVDAATTGDCFGVVLVTRHPVRHDDPAIRACRKWDPKERGGKIDYEEPEAFIRTLVHGGCFRGHPQYPPFRRPAAECDHEIRAHGCEVCCEACRDNSLVPPYNIIEVAYDPYQMESMMGRLYKEAVNCQPFSQQQQRMVADSMLYDVIINARLAHDGNPSLREHILNCAAKQSKDEDTKLRIVKKAPDRKIDLAVASSMGVRRVLYLLI